MANITLTPHKNYADVVIIGNGSAGAGAVNRFNRYFKENSDSELTILVLDALTKEEKAAQMPEYNARVTFPHDVATVTGLSYDDFKPAFINSYKDISFYSPRGKVHKKLPQDSKGNNKVVLLDTDKMIDVLESDLSDNIKIRYHKQAYDAEYVGKGIDEMIKLLVQYPFRCEKVFETTDEIYTKAVIDCSGTGSLMLDKMQGYRRDSDIVCGVLGFKVINASIDPNEAFLGLDDETTHGAGLWGYNNKEISPELKEYLENWFANTTNKRIQQMIKGKTVDDFAGTISDVGISSISTYSQAQHYRINLGRQAIEAFMGSVSGGYFIDSAVIPGSDFYKPSPVLQPVSKMAGRRYLLAGDAAGHATPYIGEGVRPGIEMGAAAADILLESFINNDFSEKTLKGKFEKVWRDKYGKYDIWSDLFRHFSSTCFNDRQWDIFFQRLQDKLSDEEFYEVLKSQYTFDIVRKMSDYRMIEHYLKFQWKTLIGLLTRRIGLREVISWVR